MTFEPGQAQISKSRALPPPTLSLLEGRQEPHEQQSWGRVWRLPSAPPSSALLPMSVARFLSCQRSPAAAILELFEEQNGSLQELHYLMTLMERLDCASVIQNYLGSPAQVRIGTWENQDLELELDVKL